MLMLVQNVISLPKHTVTKKKKKKKKKKLQLSTLVQQSMPSVYGQCCGQFANISFKVYDPCQSQKLASYDTVICWAVNMKILTFFRLINTIESDKLHLNKKWQLGG